MWWYGRLQLDAAIVEAAPAPATDCSPDAIASQLNGYNRALVYVGFPDAPSGFSDHLLREIGRGGRGEGHRVVSAPPRPAGV